MAADRGAGLGDDVHARDAAIDMTGRATFDAAFVVGRDVSTQDVDRYVTVSA